MTTSKNYDDAIIEEYYDNLCEEIATKVKRGQRADQIAKECGIRRGVKTNDYETFYIKAYKKDLDKIADKLKTSSKAQNVTIDIDFDGWGIVSFQV